MAAKIRHRVLKELAQGHRPDEWFICFLFCFFSKERGAERNESSVLVLGDVLAIDNTLVVWAQGLPLKGVDVGFLPWCSRGEESGSSKVGRTYIQRRGHSCLSVGLALLGLDSYMPRYYSGCSCMVGLLIALP